MVGEHDVPTLFSAERTTRSGESLEHITVPDGGLDHLNTKFFHGDPETQIGHNGDNDEISAQIPASVKVGSEECKQMITVDHDTVLIHGEQSISIAIEGQTQIRA